MNKNLWPRPLKGKPSDQELPPGDQELQQMVARAVLVLRPPQSRRVPQPKTATAFMVSDDLAVTAAHNVRDLLIENQGAVFVKGFLPNDPNDELTFQVIPDSVPEDDDIAALRLVSERPARLGSLKTACFDPCDLSRNARLAGRPVYTYGFPKQRDDHADLAVSGMGIEGRLDSSQPLRSEISSSKNSHRTILKMNVVIPVEMNVQTGETPSLAGMSGAPIIDKDTGYVIGVLTHDREGWGRIDGVPLCLLAKKLKEFGNLCRQYLEPPPPPCRWCWPVVILTLGILSAAVWKFSCHPSIEITQIPACGAGPTVMSTIRGKTHCADRKAQRVVLYALTDRWYVQPDTAKPTTDIGPDGTFANATHLGSQYAVLLLEVDSSFQPPMTTLALPQPGDGIVAIDVVDCQ
jgi:hypothetical protein